MFPGVMREQDIRQRIESFLKRTARELIIPASVGLSLGLSGCSDAVYKYGTLFPLPDAGADVGVDTALPDSGVDAVAPDADVDVGMIDGETD